MIYSTILLVFVVGTNPVQLRIVDSVPSWDVCNSIIAKVKQQEILEPESERIGNRLQCISMSYKSDHDDDGPSKPVIPPAIGLPEETSHVVKCRNKISGKEKTCPST